MCVRGPYDVSTNKKSFMLHEWKRRRFYNHLETGDAKRRQEVRRIVRPRHEHSLNYKMISVVRVALQLWHVFFKNPNTYPQVLRDIKDESKM
jgi:hypothetical protein